MLAQTNSRGIRAGATCSSATRRMVTVRATPRQSSASDTVQQAVSAVLAAGVALSLTFGAPSAASAAPIRLEERRAEKEAALQEQMRKLQYAFEQQQTAKKADIAAKRQQLENTVQQVDTVIQRKLIEEAANEQAAAKKGEEQRAARIEAEAQRIKAQEQQVQLAAAKAEAELDRQETLLKAEEAAQQQQVKKASGSMMELLGLKDTDLGL